MKPPSLLLLACMLTQAAEYSATRAVADGIEIVRLAEPARGIEVSIVPSIGNIAYELKVNGKNAFWFPFANLAEFRKKPAMCGNPLMAPWANRFDQDAFYANGKKYMLNASLGNLRRDPNQQPIHGLLLFSPAWEVVSVKVGDRGAEYTARLEFWRHPDLMAQFPFAHTIVMTYRLHEGVLEVETALGNHASEPMPIAVGYHPYFRLHDAPKEEWSVHIAASEEPVLSNLLVPTGERKPTSFRNPVSLKGTEIDTIFTGLHRDASGNAEFYVRGKKEQISVVYGPKYSVAIVYAPVGREFICFEPMAAITNAFNLAQHGKYTELQSLPSGGTWRESFWVKVSGF
jgi:aldose 1-epimerase